MDRIKWIIDLLTEISYSLRDIKFYIKEMKQSLDQIKDNKNSM